MVEEENIKNTKKSKEYWFKVIGVSLVIICGLVLISLKTSDPERSMKNPLIIGGIIIVIGIISFFGNSLQKKFKDLKKDDDERPKIIDKEQIMEILEEQAHKRWNNIKLVNGVEVIATRTINKNQIYAYKVNMVLDDESMIVVLNATYPEIEPTILSIKCHPATIKKEMNNKSINPDSEPETEESEETIDAFGKPVRKTKKITPKKKEKKKEEAVL